MAHFSWFFRIKIELHFSLIAAAVTYIMWKNVGNDKIQKMEGKKFPKEVDQIDSKKRRYWRVDCQSASKGLFLGKVTLEMKNISSLKVTFFIVTVRKHRLQFQNRTSWMLSRFYADCKRLLLTSCNECSFTIHIFFLKNQKLRKPRSCCTVLLSYWLPFKSWFLWSDIAKKITF